jgi:hypothetical protein
MSAIINKISIKIILNEDMRPGIGGADWYLENDVLQVRVVRLSTQKRTMELAVHETTEALVALEQGITVKQVDDYDMAFEKKHPENHGLNAGDQSDCPYKRAHCAATAIERILAFAWDENWQEYDDELSKIGCESGESNV